MVTLWRVTIFMKKMEVIVLTHDTKRPNKQYISRIMMITVIFGCWRTSLRGRTFIGFHEFVLNLSSSFPLFSSPCRLRELNHSLQGHGEPHRTHPPSHIAHRVHCRALFYILVCNYKIYKLSREELGMLNNIKWHKIHGLSETVVNGDSLSTEIIDMKYQSCWKSLQPPCNLVWTFQTNPQYITPTLTQCISPPVFL